MYDASPTLIHAHRLSLTTNFRSLDKYSLSHSCFYSALQSSVPASQIYTGISTSIYKCSPLTSLPQALPLKTSVHLISVFSYLDYTHIENSSSTEVILIPIPEITTLIPTEIFTPKGKDLIVQGEKFVNSDLIRCKIGSSLI